MGKSHTHSIIWRELHANKVEQPKQFYQQLLGWRFKVEKAMNFAWGEGAGEYFLIEASGEIHGGFAQVGDAGAYWLSYVQVDDVEAAVRHAEKLGATIVKAPFDVPGVGVNAVIADPVGALIGVSAPSYSSPPPAGVFVCDHLLTDDHVGAKSFYKELFGWAFSEGESVSISDQALDGASSLWAPVLAVSHLDDTIASASDLGSVIQRLDGYALVVEPSGAVFGLTVSE